MPYEHEHPVIDADKHYIIDPISRTIVNATSKKNTLIQNDHNSEEFTFEIPKHVDGHDMSLCNSVQIHYINVESGTSKKQTGLYEVTNFPSDVPEEVDGNLTFSWVISGNATKYAGTLSFLISFVCIVDGIATYRWNTGINSTITVAKGILNDNSIVESYPDILSKWRKELFETNYAYEAALKNGFRGTEVEWLESLNGMSAYQIAVRNGFEGNEREWLDSLVATPYEKYTYEIVIPASGWTAHADYAGYYVHTEPNILVSDNPHVAPNLPDGYTDTTLEMIAEYQKIKYSETGDGQITFYAFEEIPTMDISILIEVVR